MPWHKRNVQTLLDAVTATGAGSTVNLGPKPIENARYLLKSASITTGGTIKVQGSEDDSTWYDLVTVAVSATGNTSAQIAGPIPKYIRGNCTARTDGTYTLTVVVTEKF